LIWRKHEIVGLAEDTLNAWNQMVAAVAEITGLTEHQAETELRAKVATPWEVHRWKTLTDKVEAVEIVGPKPI